MKISEIREKSSDDLAKQLVEIAKEIFELRCTTERPTPEKGAQMRGLKRDVARIKTVLRQRELGDEVLAELKQVDARLEEIEKISGKQRSIEQANANFKLRFRKKQLERTQRELEIVKGK